MFKNEFTCTATDKTYKVRGSVTCKSENVVHLISCKACKQQYVCSVFESNFNPRLSDTNTGKVKCGMAKHFINNCPGITKLGNVEIQLVEEVKEGNYDFEGKLGQEIKIGKPSYLLLHTVWVVLGIGSAVKERALEKRKNGILLLVFRMFHVWYRSIYI